MIFANTLILVLLISLTALVFTLVLIRMFHYAKLAYLDETTNLENFRGFQKTINKIIAKHNKNNTSFTFAIFDIDQFRNYNCESYAFGDCVLQEYVKFVKKNLPKDTSIARFKFGDEFIIVLNRDRETSFEIIQSIQKKCKEKIFYDQQNLRSFNVRFSYGLTLFEQNIDTIATLLIKAEKSLKENKLFSLDKLSNNDHIVFENFPFKELINN